MSRAISYWLTIFLLSFSGIFLSCSNQTENAEVVYFADGEIPSSWAENVGDKKYIDLLRAHLGKNYVEKDTLLLGYVIGWERKKILEHSSRLISDNIISSSQQQKITYHRNRGDIIFPTTIESWSGYNFKFQRDSSTECKGFINYFIKDSSLAALRLFITDNSDINELKSFLQGKYGEPNYKLYKYLDEFHILPSLIYIWLSGGKEIQLIEWFNYSMIIYCDIKERYNEEIELINSQNKTPNEYQLEKIKTKEADSLEKQRLKLKAEEFQKVF